MPNAEFHTGTYQIPNPTSSNASSTVYLRYLLANHREIRLRYVPNNSVKDSGYYGINATYNDNGPNLVGVAIDSGSYIRSSSSTGYNGEQNRNPAIECGTFAVLDDPVSGGDGASVFLLTDKIDVYDNHEYTIGSTTITATTSNTLMAVGGTSLFPSENLTKNQYNSRISNEDPGGGATGYAPRSAIIYLGGNHASLNTVLLTVHSTSGTTTPNNGCLTFWQLRQLIIDYFGPMTSTGVITHAIALDGGGSTQIAYKKSNGSTGSYQVDGNRNARSMLCVEM
jgi:exopolysaccharide biosynthesis protein